MITPILLYGSEVWECENVDIIGQFYLKFCKSLLDAKVSTSSVMIYEEHGTLPLHLKIKTRVLNFWYRIVSDKKEKKMLQFISANALFACK